MTTRLTILALAAALATAASAQSKQSSGVCVLRAERGGATQGEVWFADTKLGVRITVCLQGLEPRGEYAVSMHLFGDEGLPTDAGFGDPFSRRGVADAGQLGRVKVGADGAATGVRDMRGVKLADVLGRGVILRKGDAILGSGVIGLGNDWAPPSIKVLSQELKGARARLVCEVIDDRALASFGAKGQPPSADLQREQPQKSNRYVVELPSRGGKNSASLVAIDGAGNAREVPVEWVHDATAPLITVLAPKQGSQLNGNPVNVVASVEDENLASVTINARPATQDDKGRWRGTVQAKDGENHVAVRAADAFGNATEVDVVFTFDGTPPGVEADATIVVDGKVDDLSATLTVNGQPVRFDPKTGAYSAKVKADPRDPGRVTIVATDEYGNRTTEVRKLR